MNESQKIELRRSKIRERLAEVSKLEGDKYSDEIKTEERALQDEFQGLEARHRSAIISEADELDAAKAAAGEGDAEARALQELRGKVRLGNYVSAAVEQRAAAGAELEFNQTLGIAGNRFPLELLSPPEVRATTGVDTATVPSRWVDRLFAGSAAAAVGITMESVPAGVASFPVTSAGASAAQRGRAEAAADAAWTISVSELKPTRNSVRVVFSVEDAVRIPGLESALTRDFRMALMEGIDRACFLGDSGASENTADITGLMTAAGLVEKTISQANKVKGSNVLAEFASLIDGKAAMMPSDLKAVFAVGANTLWAHSLANSGASVDTTIAEFLRRFGLSWMTRGELETATAADDFAAFVGLGRGIEGSAVAAVWNSGELIRDPYTNAAKGEVALTLLYLWGFGLPRASNFARVKFVA